MSQCAALAHEATFQGGVVVNGGAGSYDEVVCNDTVTYDYRSGLIGDDGPVLETGSTAYLSKISDVYSIDVARVAYTDVVADAPARAFLGSSILLNEFVQGGDGVRMMAVHCEDVCRLCTEAVIYLYFATTCFIEHGHFHAITEAARTVSKDEVRVLYVTIRSNVVVCDIIRYVLNEGIISNCDVVEGNFAEAAVLLEATREGKVGLELTKAYGSGEAYVADIFEGVRMRGLYGAPVLCLAATGD